MTANVNQEQLLDMAVGIPDQNREDAFWNTMFSTYISYIHEVSPWWSPTRDRELRYFWKDGLYGSAIMTLAQGKLASMPMKIVARDKSIMSHVIQAEEATALLTANSGFGSGWYTNMLPFVEDFLGQDNGSFFEILGEGEPDGPIEGPVMGIRHLDSARCQRTGHPVYPVIYSGEDGRKYKLHFARVFSMSQMPSADQNMRGVGLCSVSRSLRIIENLANTVNYKDEKMGARPVRQLLVGSGINGNEIVKAMAASEVMMDNIGLRDTARTVALGSTSGDIDIKKVELSHMDRFDEAATFTFASYALALAWGVEFNEVIPLSNGRQSEIIALQRSRGMLPAQFIRGFEEQAAIKLVPPHLKLTLDYQDDQADKEHALIEDIVSRSFGRQMEAGVTTPETVQVIMHDRGYLSDEQMADMRLSRHMLPNGLPVATAYSDENFSDLLIIDRRFLASTQNEPEEAAVAIEENKLHVYAWLGTSPAARAATRGKIALSALEWLEEQYNKRKMQQDIEEPEEENAVPDRDEEEADKGLQYPATSFFIENNRVRWNDVPEWG